VSEFLQWDVQLLVFVNQGLANPVLTRVMLFITEKYNWYPLIGIALFLLLLAGRRLPHQGSSFQKINPRVFVFGLVMCVLFADQSGSFLKHNVERIRPNRDDNIAPLLDCRLHTAGRRSFPSNHAANSAAIAVFSSLVYPQITAPVLLVSFLLGFSRVYLAVHYPSDVFAGWILGSAVGFLVWIALRKRLTWLGITGFSNLFRYRQHQITGSPGEHWAVKQWVSLDGYPVTGYLLSGSEKLVIFAHGLGGSFLSRAVLGEKLKAINGTSFLLIPLRGSDGHPIGVTSGGTDEAHDILGALRFAVKAGFLPGNIIVYGTSMGGSAAIKACSLAGELLPAGIVVHGAFSSFFLSAKNRTGKTGCALLKFLMPGRAVRSLEGFRPVYWLGCLNIGCAVEYIYADGDRVSPPREGELMLKHTGSTSCGLTILAGHSHPTGRNACGNDLVSALNDCFGRIWAEGKR
jgi:undecaprenyl-diphosphatase